MTRELLKRARDLIAEYIDVPGEEWTHVHCDEDAGGQHNLDLEWLEQDMLQLVREIDEALATPVPAIDATRLAHAGHIAESHCAANAYHCVGWESRKKMAARVVNVYESLSGSYP